MILPFFMFKFSQKAFGSVDPSQHPESFGIRDGLEESFPQFLLGGVFWEQQCIKAGVRGW